MPEPVVSLVELLRVASVEELHATGERGACCAEDEVVVRRHQAERVHRPVEALDAAAEVRQEVQAVGVVEVDVAGSDAAPVDVEVAVRERGSKDAGHALDESGRSTESSRL